MKQTQQSLFPQMASAEPAPVRRVPRPAHRDVFSCQVPLWLAAHLPKLSLETLLRGQVLSAPRAVIDVTGGIARVHAVNARAADGGVSPGVTLAAAWSLLPGLEVHERDAARERQLLHRLAAWAGRFTPTVCVDEQALLLEVRGSLQLFNGAGPLRDAVSDGMAQLGFTPISALAPTPRAALWLAQAGHDVHVDQLEELPAVLGGLPLRATGFEPGLLERFHGIGARHVRDLLRLPRDGFARRYSARVLRELDQALGRAPDVRRPLPPPKRFSARIDLLYEVSETGRLLHPVQQLLRELDGYLLATQQGVSRLRLQFFHRDTAFTEVLTGFAGATRDGKRMRDLLEQKLETVALPSPVLEVALHAEELVMLPGCDRTLFAEQRGDEDWPQLVERLRVRLGEEAVGSIEQRDDHRPERSWGHVAAGAATESRGLAGRPQWLLETPQVLQLQDGKPVCDGPLEILDGPERIETGWWDETDVTRDYYIARDPRGRRLWICEEVRTGRWWLQGIFG